MANMKLIIAVFVSLFVANSMANPRHPAAGVLERRAEALEVRAERLQDLAAVYRRALTSIDDEIELVERGPRLDCHCDHTIPFRFCPKFTQKAQEMYAKDTKWHKYKKAEIFVPRDMATKLSRLKRVAVALYNEDKRPLTAPIVYVSL